MLEPRRLLGGCGAYSWGGDIDWHQGCWGVRVSDSGTPGSPGVSVDLPGGMADTGNALEVYYVADLLDTPQFWVFLTDGFFRQAADGSPFGTSARLFRYFSSSDEDQDVSFATNFRVVGVTADDQLQLDLNYENDDSASGDKFTVRFEATLSPPTRSETEMDATITVTNESGRAVVPAWQGHRDLAEQWTLLSLSSMYVADNLTGDLPAWYADLDPDEAYVGTVNDASYLNDGYSVNGGIEVSTHDVKSISVGSVTKDLDHDPAVCPPILVPGLEWHEELVLLDQPGSAVALRHLYQPERHHSVELLGASGITADLANLKWAATYNRHDINLVDGDNVQVKLGLDDHLNRWQDGASQTVKLRITTGSAFSFTIDDGRFLRDEERVFLNVIGYQPLEPGQAIGDEIRLDRVRDDLRRLEQYQGGSNPIVLRIYAQPTDTYPVRMPQEFYDGVRELGFWIIRDIYFEKQLGTDAVERGKASIDAVIAEVESVGALDRIFAWEFGNEEFEVQAGGPDVASFLRQMRNYLKEQLHQPSRVGASDWVTWNAYPPTDVLRTDGNPVLVEWDFYSVNAYSYEPARMRDHQPGPVTGTPYAGYLQALREEVHWRFGPKPIVVSETGLPDSVQTAGDNHNLWLPWYPSYRKGGLNEQQVYEALVDRYMDARLSGAADGLGIFEWLDEWHKAGTPDSQDHPEEAFGLHRFVEVGPGDYELQAKLQQEAVRDLFTRDYRSDQAVVLQVVPAAASVPPGGSATIQATLNPQAPGPVRLRWESSRGRIVGDSDSVTFYPGNVSLGPALITVAATDAKGKSTTASTTIEIPASGLPIIEIHTFGEGSDGVAMASGRVEDLDLDSYKLLTYIFTDNYYIQPYNDVPWTYARSDGFWWTPIANEHAGELVIFAVPRDYDPRVDGTPGPGDIVAEARLGTVNDTDNNLLPDDWEQVHFGGLGADRYADPDRDLASNLEECLAAWAPHQFVGGFDPNIADNDGDGGVGDNLPDNWEYLYFRTLAYTASDDPEGDGITNAEELTDPVNDPGGAGLGTHPGRTSPDRDRDQMPDAWEMRHTGTSGTAPGVDLNGDGLSNLQAYRAAVSPVLTHSFFHAADQYLVADDGGERMTFRGINLTGLEYGGFFDYPYTGQEGIDFSQPWAGELFTIADAGMNLVRLPFEWARLVPGWQATDPLPANLDAGYLTLLDNVVETASRHGLYVLLDMHDFLKYWPGQSEEPVGVNVSPRHQELLVRTWELLAAHFAGTPAVLGYDLMNEPLREPPGSSNWHAIAQRVVDAIRSVDGQHLIVVEGPNYSLASHWYEDNPAPAITDSVQPPRIVYSPHVYFDYNNDSQYDGPGEDTGPVEYWEYLVRDRLMPVIDWSEQYGVPILLGELGAPCTVDWAQVLEHVYDQLLDPWQISAAAWQYIDPQRWQYLPRPTLNLADCDHLLEVLADHPGGAYDAPETYTLSPLDSLIYADPPHDALDNPILPEHAAFDPYAKPWDSGQDDNWNPLIDYRSTDFVSEGEFSIRVEFQDAWDGVKFARSFGLNTTPFANLTFRILPTTDQVDFRIFTFGPNHAEYPPEPPTGGSPHRPLLSDYISLTPNQWHTAEIPLRDIVAPGEPMITGIALQAQDPVPAPFYLDEIRLVSAPRIDITLVREPTSLADPLTGEVARLPASEVWLDEWTDFFVEVWGVSGGASLDGFSFDLRYATSYHTPDEVMIGPAFSAVQPPVIDDSGGVVIGLRATHVHADAGDDRPALLARLHFTQGDADPGIPMKELVGIPQPAVDFSWLVENAELTLAAANPVPPEVGLVPNTELWPVTYDIDDDGRIFFADFAFFASAFLSSAGNGPYSWASDFDGSGRTDFSDFAFFAANFQRANTDTLPVIFPANYPDDWRQQALRLAERQTARKATTAPTKMELAPIVNEVVARIEHKEGEQATAVNSEVMLGIIDLSEDMLGVTVGGSYVDIDLNAAGYGWFIDQTPWDAVEFSQDIHAGDLAAMPGRSVQDRADLLTVVLREIGDMPGYRHEGEGIMDDELSLGTRRLPPLDLDGVPGSDDSESGVMDRAFASFGLL